MHDQNSHSPMPSRCLRTEKHPRRGKSPGARKAHGPAFPILPAQYSPPNLLRCNHLAQSGKAWTKTKYRWDRIEKGEKKFFSRVQVSNI